MEAAVTEGTGQGTEATERAAAPVGLWHVAAVRTTATGEPHTVVNKVTFRNK